MNKLFTLKSKSASEKFLWSAGVRYWVVITIILYKKSQIQMLEVNLQTEIYEAMEIPTIKPHKNKQA